MKSVSHVSRTTHHVRIDWLFFVLVMVVAIFLRFYKLADFPQGLLGDETVNGLEAWRLWNRGGHTVFLPGNGGREALMVYLQSLSIALFGTTPFALRLPPALIDTLTVAWVYWFGRAFFVMTAGEREKGGWGVGRRGVGGLGSRGEGEGEWFVSGAQWGALFAGLWMGVSHWLLAVSRLGFRAGLVPFLAVPMLWAFLLGWRSGRRRWFITAGGLLGLLGYTYTAARVLPLVLLLAGLGAFVWPEGRDRRSMAGGLAALVITAFLVYLPMLVYTLANPQQAGNRTFSVAIWANTGNLASALWENLVATAAFFCCRGNEHLIFFGLPGRPAQDIVLGLFLLAGIIYSVRAFKQMPVRVVLLWFFLAWLPTLLAIEAPHPLRLIAAAPAAALLAATGVLWLCRYWRWAGPLLALWLLASGLATFRDYFIRWPAQVDVAGLFRYDLTEQYEALDRRLEGGEILYLSSEAYAQPRLRFYLSGQYPPRPVAEFAEPAPRVTFVGRPDAPAWVRLSPGEALILPPARDLGEWSGEITMDGRDLEWAGQFEALNYRLGPANLAGATFSQVIVEDGPLDVTLFWEATAPIETDYDILVHVVDDAGQGWSEETASQTTVYPTSLWRAGRDLMPDTHRLYLKDGLPAGRYRLAVSLFDPIRGRRLPVISPQGAAPDTVFLGPLKVPLVGEGTEDGGVPVGAVFEGVAILQEVNLSQTRLQAGQPLTVALIWQGTDVVSTDYTVFVHLLNEAGERVAGHDSQPVGGRYPTTIWTPGERIPDRHVLDTAGLPPGRYRAAVGLYNAQTGQRVPLLGMDGDQVLLDSDIIVTGE